MSYIGATFHAAYDLIYALHNTRPARPLVKPKNQHNKSLITIAKIFIKIIPPAVPPRVPVGEVVQEKLKEVNQEIFQIKSASQSKPFTNEEPLRVPIVNSNH